MGQVSKEEYYLDLKQPSFYYYVSRNKDSQIDSIGFFINGEKTGDWEMYDELGNLSSKGPYHRGKREGYWSFSYRGSTEMNEGNFEMGSKVGLWKYFNPEHQEVFYDNGEEKLVNYWEGEKQPVKNGEGFISWTDSENKGKYTHYFQVKKYYKDSLNSNTTRKFVRKVRNKESKTK